jgi:hypothetical protein
MIDSTFSEHLEYIGQFTDGLICDYYTAGAHRFYKRLVISTEKAAVFVLNVLIIGPPGAGKPMSVQRLAFISPTIVFAERASFGQLRLLRSR